MRSKYGGVAQLGEHLPCKQGVMGSNPIISTTVAEPSLKTKTAKILKKTALFRAQSEKQGRTNTSLAAEPTPHIGS